MGGVEGVFPRSVKGRVSRVSLLFASVLPLIYLVWDLLPRLTSHGNIEYEVSALVALGTAGCLGHLAARVYQGSGGLSHLCSLLGVVQTPDTLAHTEATSGSADWPLLVALLFGPFLVLLAGLGGWV
ncbi:MAG: hypothetical protein WA990_09475 [Rubrobacteraceae bacterium]